MPKHLCITTSRAAISNLVCVWISRGRPVSSLDSRNNLPLSRVSLETYKVISDAPAL